MELIQVKKLSQWKQIYKLYRSAFPKYERKPFYLIWLKHKKGCADVWTIGSGNEFAGLAITMNSGDMVLLDYFAVCEEKRGNGLGGKALRELQDHYKGKRFFLEIESVYDKAENISERKRRKSFYLSNGMTEMKVMANVFGTAMELLGHGCEVSFSDYRSVYCNVYGEWAAKNLAELTYPSADENDG